MNKIITVLLSVILLSGCSEKIVKEYVYIEKDISIIKIKESDNLNKINLKVVDNKIILNEEEFKNLTENIIIIKNRILYLESIIKYYEDNLKKEPSK